jgi:hypothetical protein
MAIKRFLNVQYEGKKTKIDILGLERLSQVMGKIKEKYHLTQDSIQLWKKTATEKTLINTWNLLNSLPGAYFEEKNGIELTIVLLP